MLAAVLTLSAAVAGLVAVVFIQGREVRKARGLAEEIGELKVLLAASKVANADKDKAISELQANLSSSESTLAKLRTQRDDLLRKTLDDPSSIAAAVRSALGGMRDL